MSAGATRRDAVRRALAAAPLLLLGAAAPAAAAAKGEGDAAVLESAIGLEQAAAFAYRTAAGTTGLDARTVLTLERFGRHEDQHAAALRTALESLGGTAPPPPRTLAEIDRVLPGLGQARSRTDVLQFAVELESAQVATYHDAHAKLSEPRILQTVATIMGCQGQHLAVLRAALGAEPLPSAFETGER